MKAYIDSQPIFQQFSNASQREELVLEEDDYALCNYRLYAYKLRSRDWGMLICSTTLIIQLTLRSSNSR